MSSVDVGKISTFGNGSWEYCGQIWQTLLDSRDGSFPLHVSTSPSGTPPDGIQVGKVSSFGMSAEDYRAQIWQMLIDSRTGAAPLTIINV